MTKIGLLSDTHGHLDEKFIKHLSKCDEIWHAGDVGNHEIIEKLQQIAVVRAVHGNIDGGTTRQTLPWCNRFQCEQTDVLISHIVGYPGKYDGTIKSILASNPPKLLVGGHSHILKAQFDKTYNMLFLNPGAAGKYGFHKVRTIMTLEIDGTDIRDLQVIELPK